jgi:hypothetical protein
MTQQLFDDLTTDPPPSTVDVPGIVRREKRRRTVVRAGVPAAAVLAVASVIVALNSGNGPVSGPSAVSVPSAMVGPSSAAAAPVPGFRLVASDQAATAATAETLRKALDAAVHRAAPDATWLAQGLTKTVTPDGQPPRIVGDDLKNPTDQMFSGTTGISVDGRRGTLSLQIISIDPCTGGALAKCPAGHENPEAVRQDMEKGLYACQPAAQTCTASTRPDGRRQRVQTSVSLGGFVSQETTVELADGRALMLTVDNQFIPPGSSDNSHDVAQSATPLSPDQVTATATTIGDQILP